MHDRLIDILPSDTLGRIIIIDTPPKSHLRSSIKKNKNLPMKMSKYKITNFFFGASMEILKFMEGAEQIKHTEYYLKWLKLTIKLVS